jgi:hypothetical protein
MWAMERVLCPRAFQRAHVGNGQDRQPKLLECEVTVGLCWLSHSEQMMLRHLLKVAAADNEVRDEMASRIMELTRDNERLRAEIGTLQHMRHAALEEKR